MIYIVSQVLVQEWSGCGIKLTTAIRRVSANSEFEAVGKFIKDTSGLNFERRVEPVLCYLESNIKTI